MKIGVPKEIKNGEYRVGLTPGGVAMLVQAGHQVMVETNAGAAIGFSDKDYENAGAQIAKEATLIWSLEMVIKVKEPIEKEYVHLRNGLILFCYLHLAPNAPLTKALIEKNCIAIAYDTVTDASGGLPLLMPMSEIAGRLSIQVGALSLLIDQGGKGILLGGGSGVLPAKVIVLGGGISGTEAARVAIGSGADVTIIDRNLQRLKQLDMHFGPAMKTLYSNTYNLAKAVKSADLLIGAVLIPGKSAPKLITRAMIASMEKGSVFVDISIDQGGCSETSRPTTHSNPTYIEEGVVHYCVTNMPGAVAKTSSEALTNATLRYALEIANLGYKAALKNDKALRQGLNIYEGKVTNQFVADDLNYKYTPAEALLG